MTAHYCTTSKTLSTLPLEMNWDIEPVLPVCDREWTLHSTAVGNHRIFWTWTWAYTDKYNGEYGVMKSEADQERESREAGNPPKFEVMEDCLKKNRIMAEHIRPGMVIDYAGRYRKVIGAKPGATLGRTSISFEGLVPEYLSLRDDQEFTRVDEVDEVDEAPFPSEIVLVTKADGSFGIYVNPPEDASFTREEMERVATAFEKFLPEKEDEDGDEPCDPPLPTFYEGYAALVLAPPFPPYPHWESSKVKAAWLLTYPAAAKYLEEYKDQARDWNAREFAKAQKERVEKKGNLAPKGWTRNENGGWDTQSRRSDEGPTLGDVVQSAPAAGEGAHQCDGCMHAREDKCMILEGGSRRPPSIGRAVELWVDGDEQGVCPGRKEVPDPPPEGWTRNENGGWDVEGSADTSPGETEKEKPYDQRLKVLRGKNRQLKESAQRWEGYARDWYAAAQEALGTGSSMSASELRARMKSTLAEVEPLKKEIDGWVNWGRELTGKMFLGREKLKHQITRKFQETGETEKRLKRAEKELHLWRDWGLSHSDAIYSNEGLRGNISNKLNAERLAE